MMGGSLKHGPRKAGAMLGDGCDHDLSPSNCEEVSYFSGNFGHIAIKCLIKFRPDPGKVGV